MQKINAQWLGDILKGDNAVVTETMFSLPTELYEAAHQEQLFATLFGTYSEYRRNMHLRPKLVYRSDSRRRIYILYQLQDDAGKGVFVVIACDPSKEGPVNATAAWCLTEQAREGSTLQLLTAALVDIEYHINHDGLPADRAMLF